MSTKTHTLKPEREMDMFHRLAQKTSCGIDLVDRPEKQLEELTMREYFDCKHLDSCKYWHYPNMSVNVYFDARWLNKNLPHKNNQIAMIHTTTENPSCKSCQKSINRK